MAPRILIADDEPEVLATLARTFGEAGFQVLEASDGRAAWNLALQHQPAALILGGQLPDWSGRQVCQAVRHTAATARLPVLLLSRRKEEAERVLAFEVGADDYIVKPLSTREVLLRVQAILRRGGGRSCSDAVCQVGDICIDTVRHEVTASGRRVELTTIEYKLLTTLAFGREHVFSRDELLSAVWGSTADVGRRTIDTHLRRLRNKLHTAAGQVRTVRGFGYSLADG